MVNPIPTLSVVNYKGSGNVAVHKLLNGLTLDPTQDGSDVLTGTLETPNATFENLSPNRLIEAFGKRFLLHGNRIYERDQGGAGNWGEVTGLGQSTTSQRHSGIHLLYPNGAPTLAVLLANSTAYPSNYSIMSSTDGASWSHTDLGVSANSGGGMGTSAVFRDSICWIHGNITNQVVIHDLKLSTTIYPTVPSTANAGTSSATLLVHQNELFYFAEGSFSGFRPGIWRLDGTSWTRLAIDTLPAGSGNNSTGEAHTMWSDGKDIIAIIGNIGTSLAVRISDVLLSGTPSFVDITSTFNFDAGQAGAFSYRSVDPSPLPGDQAVYYWHRVGNHNTGSYKLYRWNYRQITHGAVTNGPFQVNETITQTTSGATGVVAVVGAGSLDLTEVTGTFNNTDTLTGGTSGATASATSLLVDQATTLLGVGIAASNFSILNQNDGGLERIPIKGEARPEFDGLPTEQSTGRKRFFRVYGTGSALTLSLYYDADGEAPNTLATLVASTITIESGVPATTPTNTTSQITNLTPDGGATLYSIVHDIASDGLTVGKRHSILIDIV